MRQESGQRIEKKVVMRVGKEFEKQQNFEKQQKFEKQQNFEKQIF